jgi:hypothetical protein
MSGEGRRMNTYVESEADEDPEFETAFEVKLPVKLVVELPSPPP